VPTVELGSGLLDRLVVGIGEQYGLAHAFLVRVTMLWLAASPGCVARS
jgi:hypothetical protein